MEYRHSIKPDLQMNIRFTDFLISTMSRSSTEHMLIRLSDIGFFGTIGEAADYKQYKFTLHLF